MPGNESDPPAESAQRGPVVLLVDGNEKRCQRVRDRLQGEIAIDTYTSPSAAMEALDQSVAVLIVSARFPDEDIRRLIANARARSPFSHIGLLARDPAAIESVGVEHDEALTSPLSWGEFTDTVTSMLLRAQYLAGLQRFYKQSLALNSRRIELKGQDPSEDEQFRHITDELSRLEGRLDALSEQFTPEEYRAVMGRIQTGEERSLGEGKPVTNPSVFGLPDECPRCGLPFGHWHGHTLGHGFERIAANVWRCTECDLVFDNPDPSDRRIARR